MSGQPDIIYTKVDEAPELASGSFFANYPIFCQDRRSERGHEGYLLGWQNHCAILG